MRNLKTSLILSSIASIALFTGCGGGGGGGYTPIPPAETTSDSSLPLSTLNDPCAAFRDGRNADKYLTAEYCRMQELGRLGVSTAYSNGYTGQGVTVAVLDSGADMSNSDLSTNSLSSAISYDGVHYDTSTGTVVATTAGVTSDQIETINLSSGGSGYTTAPTVTVSGDGTGAKAIAILDGNGAVSGIYMTDRGSGYTNATFTIDDSGTGGSGAIIDNYYMGGYDDYGHGTSVAGIIGADKDQDTVDSADDGTIQGVAYNADILNIKVLDENGVGAVWEIESGVDYAVNQGAQVINMSLGTTDANAFSKQSFSDGVAANSSFVIAAGNSGLDCLPVNGSIDGQCDFPAALPWLDGNSDLLTQDGGWIVVGSVDANNNISSFSNKAGVTKDHYLVAPGEGVLSTSTDGQMTYNTGTSFATPFVSGAMALMIEKYPHLKGKDVAQIFFDTAQDLGAAGVDDVYGNGLIDVYAAFAPIGSLGITASGITSTVSNSTKIPLTATSLSASGAIGASLVSSSALESTVAFDDWGRDFNVDMTSAVSVSTTNDFSFDNFFSFNYGDFILGLDQINQSAMIGYRTSKNTKIMLSADDSLFGAHGEGLLGFDNERTLYGAFEGIVYPTKEDFKVVYRLNYGFAQASAKQDSLITDISNMHALGGSLKAYYKNFGVGYKVPLTTVKGSMTLTVPTGREIDGTVIYSKSQENMFNSDYERDYSVFYELSDQTFNAYIAYELIKNYGGIKSDSLYNRVTVSTHYYF